jgi:hypothetical protein
MAENKKSIIVYAEWLEQFEYLTDEEAGKLIKHFFRYVNDLNPIAPDRFTEAQFIPIKQTLKRDLDKWEKTLQERSVNGRLGNIKKYNIDLYNQIQNDVITLEQAEEIAKHRKTSLPDSIATKNIAKIADNVNDNVNVNVNVNEIAKATNINIPSWEEFLAYGKEKEPSVKVSALKNKYDAWIENGWKDGNDKKIVKWKVKLLQTMAYIEKNSTDEPKFSANFQHPNKPIAL